jgi:hypothetical protein
MIQEGQVVLFRFPKTDMAINGSDNPYLIGSRAYNKSFQVTLLRLRYLRKVPGTFKVPGT